MNTLEITFNAKGPSHQKALERVFKSEFGVDRVFFTTSCSSALDMAAEIIRIRPGDEVILPAFTYVTTAMGFVKRGARPVFTEIDPETGVLDLEAVKKNLSPKTKAVVPVHYAGVSMDMDPLLDLSREGGFMVIEDAAQAIGARYKDRPLGTLGDMGTYSFHHTKNLSTGEGGALVVGDPALMPRAGVIFEKGTDRRDFIAGIKSEYSWVDLGGSYEMSDFLKAKLLEEMGKLQTITGQRKILHERYQANFKGSGLRTLRIPDYATSNYHIFALLFEGEEDRNRMIAVLKRRGIEATFHYQPLHLSPFGEKKGYSGFSLPRTEAFAGGILRLPLYPDLSTDQVDCISEIILKEWRNLS